MLADLGLLGFERDILLAIQLDVITHIAEEHVVARRWQLRALWMRDEEFLQLELARLEFRLDLFDEMQVSLLCVGVVRVTRHGDVTARRFLVERGAEFAPRHQPRFQISHGLGRRDTRFELVKQRRNLSPIAQVELHGHELTGFVSRQQTKRQ